ncbi:uncharacterized protein LOC131298263 [Rhododendron vialii]|uniref:uncharacterized protein LOC131298263 n=1 Tax=Rhododendron vialii TaxID=182163 RepID=UPI00265DCE70|nr:uncharacterized protein LOC131298263 [Rhododendron vialii]XP_058179611.1 uncharacterized protein LOC131298263 [Rhododendron vialii]XP_058179612.1 uncharacterized protein LOC131298263 [Rhododendron vialii]
MSDKNQATQKLDRSFMWKKARQNQKGEYNDDNIAKQAAKIDEITKQVDEGVLIVKGSNNILTMALGKEHPGRVRGVGQFVTPSAFFHVLRRGNHSRWEERQQFLEAMMYQMQAELNALRRHTIYTPPFEHIGSNTLISDDIESPQLHPIVMETRARRKDDLHPPNPNPKVKKSKPCKLAVRSIENIVAHGTMYETVSSDELLGDSNVRVSVDFVIVPYAHLPIPMPGSVTLVGEVVGYQVAWPKNLVLVDDEGTPKHLPKQSNKVRTTDYVPHLD